MDFFGILTFKDLDAARGCADANMLVRPLEGNDESDNNGTTTSVASSSKIIIRLVESQNEAQSSFVQFDVYMYRYHHYQPEHDREWNGKPQPLYNPIQ